MGQAGAVRRAGGWTAPRTPQSPTRTDADGDIFLADKAWFYVTLLTVGYLVSRGLAKAGSRAHHDA